MATVAASLHGATLASQLVSITRITVMTAFRIAFALLASFTIAACGGGGGGGDQSSSNGSVPAPLPTTGTIGLFFTDDPTDEFAEINLNVTEAVLIGGEGQPSLFQGSKKINLLDLTNYNEPFVFGEVPAGTYTKIRLYIDELQLVPHDRSANIYPKLPANGKVDLLDQDGFEVRAGQTVLIEIDVDANKSIKITETGNGRKYNFRPVVKVDIMDGGIPDKLARFEGTLTELSQQPADRFVVCAVDVPENCVEVRSSGSTSFFDENGLATNYAALTVNAPIVVIGRFELEPKILLRALVVEIGGTAEQISGKVVSKPANGQFLLLKDDGIEVIVEIQKNTKFFDANGELTTGSVVVGADIEVEGVFPPQVSNIGPMLMRAALIFIEAEGEQQLSGTIIAPLDSGDRSFGLATSTGDTCVRLNTGAEILLVDTAASEVKLGTVENLELGQDVDLFGAKASDSCFDANQVIVDVAAI